MAELNCKKPKLCEPEPTPAPVPCSDPFELCVGDRTLKWDGFCLTVERTRHTPDGTYTSVTVVDGCVVDFGFADEATYTPPYCNPLPANCQDAGTSTTTAVSISPSIDNTLTQTSSGLFSRSYLKGGTGTVVTGTGTVTNPYIISLNATTTGGTVTVVGNNGLVSTNTVTGVTYIGLEPTGVKTGVYDINDQFTVDIYGRITSVDKREDPLIVTGAGLKTTQQGDSVQIDHETNDIDETMVLGAYSIGVSNTGHIISTNREIDIAGGVYNFGAYDVGVNNYGSVSSIKQRADVMPSAGTFVSLDGKVISYDVAGRLTGLSTVNQSITPTAAPLPLRDMYKIAVVGSGVEKEVYGSDTQVSVVNSQVRVALPTYVVQRNQIEVHGAVSWGVEIFLGILTVNPSGSKPFTVSFRG